MSFHKRRVVITGPARKDIDAILDYTELEWGDDQRKRYRAQLRNAIGRLAGMPTLGRARDDLAPGMRAFPVDRHIICYRVTEDALFVVRVLHGRQDASTVDWRAAMEEPEDTSS